MAVGPVPGQMVGIAIGDRLLRGLFFRFVIDLVDADRRVVVERLVKLLQFFLRVGRGFPALLHAFGERNRDRYRVIPRLRCQQWPTLLLG